MSDIPSDRAALGQQVEGQSDENIVQLVQAAGVDAVLDQVFDGMRAAFLPEKAAGQSAEVQWDITTPDGVKTYRVKIADGTIETARGPAEAPRTTLGFGLADFLRFIGGKLDGMQAFMGGKLKLSGDMLFAQTMLGWFATE